MTNQVTFDRWFPTLGATIRYLELSRQPGINAYFFLFSFSFFIFFHGGCCGIPAYDTVTAILAWVVIDHWT